MRLKLVVSLNPRERISIHELLEHHVDFELEVRRALVRSQVDHALARITLHEILSAILPSSVQVPRKLRDRIGSDRHAPKDSGVLQAIFDRCQLSG